MRNFLLRVIPSRTHQARPLSCHLGHSVTPQPKLFLRVSKANQLRALLLFSVSPQGPPFPFSPMAMPHLCPLPARSFCLQSTAAGNIHKVCDLSYLVKMSKRRTPAACTVSFNLTLCCFVRLNLVSSKDCPLMEALQTETNH